MRWNRRKKSGAARTVLIFIVLGILINIQIFAANLNQSMAAYYGIEFGTEAQVASEGTNDIWQLDIWKKNYIANGQVKPETDLVGLNVSRNLNLEDWFVKSENVTVESQNMKIDYNYSLIFKVPLTEVINVSYTLITNQTYNNSALELFNWTSGGFDNQSKVTTQPETLISTDHYNKSAQEREILFHFNITESVNFTLWFNMTIELWFSADQIISIHYAALAPNVTALNDKVKTWVFLDMDGDDILEYAVIWLYGSDAILYEIRPGAIEDGWWDGELKKYWTGADWTETAGAEKNLGNLTTNMLNITIPSFLANLTPSVSYSVWSMKIESSYHWWDGLPNDPNWVVSVPIPGFQGLFLGLSVLVSGLIVLMKMKKSQKTRRIM
ncbi:MAG: hypothetical protein HWN65_20085 [Candidatus Helarchaeota archaeon]|nr:hypothetical protein [Candidatus Helarchaeota archaeon]